MTPPLDPWGQGAGYFCANASCVLHVTATDPRVQGSGHWALLDGVTYDRHPLELDGPMFCLACRRAMDGVCQG